MLRAGVVWFFWVRNKFDRLNKPRLVSSEFSTPHNSYRFTLSLS